MPSKLRERELKKLWSKSDGGHVMSKMPSVYFIFIDVCILARWVPLLDANTPLSVILQ